MSLATVLLVDDEQDILDVTRELIEDYFQEVLTAQGVAQALLVLEQRRVDIVVCDYKMPRKDGLELRRQIQKQYPHVQFVLLTGYSGHPEIIEMMQNEKFEILEKPVAPNVLIDRLKSNLATRPTVNSKIETYKLTLKPDDLVEFEKMADQDKLRLVALHDSLARKRQTIEN